MEIQDISDYVPETLNYGQPYEKLPPGKGYNGIINNAPNRGLEAMARGLKQTIEKRKAAGLSTGECERLLAKMRLTFAKKNKLKQMA